LKPIKNEDHVEMKITLKKIWQSLLVSSLIAVKAQQINAQPEYSHPSRSDWYREALFTKATGELRSVEAKAPASTPNLDAVDFSSLRWNSAAQRYVDEKGRFLSPSQVRAIVDEEIKAYNARLQDAGNKLQKLATSGTADNPISSAAWSRAVEEWREEMWEQMRLLHLSNLAAGNGGFHTLSAEDYGRVGGILKAQRAYLEQFAAQLAANPELALTDKFLERCAMYGEAGRATYERQRGVAHQKAGYKWERNVLRDGILACSGCIAESRKGWVKIGTLVKVGYRDCIVKDRCTIEYEKEKPEVGTEDSRKALKAKIEALQPDEVLEIADVPEHISKLWKPAPGISSKVILTGERRAHYLEGHKGVALDWEHMMADVITDPDFIHISQKHPGSYEFYKRIDEKYFLMIPVRVQTEPGWRKHSIMSFYKVKVSRAERDKEYRIWTKGQEEGSE
jgi:hypothetical protein